ncbi:MULTISPECIES: TetR/AcrR family transcriptional regulator [unclassified Streptomyces]|uniref:TetR/AcrR family transcriptional regulator n=1 Tax=unclassified Streptomyces TaxID=2593676 RepID=UPI00225A158F|nr:MULTISPECIES: TetR/AcrR family transcriptional regulator [unclassified Streptomyces]MCX5055275.1 TetR/AcrR family transcriptional regulator [Streptomyces sp. NBC_00474]
MVPNEKRQTTRHRRKRGSISADEIVEGAFAVARRRSLDQLSMPRLAEHLGVGVTSLYWYFRKKSDLLGAMTDVAVDRFLARMPAVRTEDSWQRAMLEHFTAQRTVHREDEVLSDLLLTRTSSYGAEATRRTMELIEAMVGKLVDAGFTPDAAMLAYNAFSVYTRGHIIHDRLLRRSNTPTLDQRQQRMTDWSSMPVLASLLDRHPLAGTTDEDFAFSAARLLCGFEVALAEQGEQT